MSAHLKYRPQFRLVANTHDVTAVIASRFVSLTLSDADGLQSDTLDIVLSDHIPDKKIAPPAKGAELELWLGYENALIKMGFFIVDSVGISFPPDRVTIKAKASIQSSSQSGAGSTRPLLTSQKTRSWPAGTKLGDMVAAIAAEHGLQPASSTEMQAVSLPQIDQVNESDMNLLTRVARTYDGVVKPAGGHLVLVKRGVAISAGGIPLTSISIVPSQVTSGRADLSDRSVVGTVIATYRDLNAAVDVEVSAGEGEPIKRLTDTFPDAETARAAATAQLNRSTRGGGSLSISMPGNADLISGRPVDLLGFNEAINGKWIIKTARHTLDNGGYKCNFSAEQG